MHGFPKVCTVTGLAWVLAVGPVAAQSRATTADLHGTVFDQSNAVLPA